MQGLEVTAQNQAKTRARASSEATETAEAAQRFLVEAIPVQVWTSDPAGKLDFVSERVVAYFETPAAEILGNGWLAVIHPDDVSDCVARWTTSLTTGVAYEVEFRLRRGDGAYRWHLGRANAQLDADGQIVRWFGTNTDVHEAKLAIAELRARSEYEQRLLGIVSHDLRNPLNTIALGVAILGDREAPPADRKIIARVSGAAARAVRLINDLLDFAKARSGSTIPINPRPTNLREIVEQIVDEFDTVAPQRIIRVGHGGVEDGRWDADRIAQVLSNLVGNALQHGAREAPIVVESRIDGDDAVFAVTNEGPLIAPGDLEAVFEPFKQGNGTSASVGGSMGLGLFIAREVVVAHGGTIEVESKAGLGTRFTVRLPRYASAEGGR
ncbi:MAG: PAS domain-containing sensor histidine kinase [Kofleriaceae bacterium]